MGPAGTGNSGNQESAAPISLAQKIERGPGIRSRTGKQRLQPLAERGLHGHLVLGGDVESVGKNAADPTALGRIGQQRPHPAAIAIEIALQLFERFKP